MDDRKSATGKRAYESPKLVRYGGIGEITNTVGNKGTDDGGMGSTDKTGTL